VNQRKKRCGSRLLFLDPAVKDPLHKARFRFTTNFLEVKHENTAAQTNFFSAEFLEESEAGSTTG
jgi:hypothetical protein